MAETLPNLGLVVWDLETDVFEHSILVNNFTNIDLHDHAGGASGSPYTAGDGKGKGIRTNAIYAENITRALLKLKAVDTPQVEDRAIGSLQIDVHGVEEENLDDESVADRNVVKETLTIDKFDPNILMLGSVIMWYRASGDTGRKPGDLWEVMDGRSWKQIDEEAGEPNGFGYTEGNIPDMREKFVRGTEIGTTGTPGGHATLNLEHSHTVAGHTHTTPGHTHPISVDGQHFHRFDGGKKLHSRPNALPTENEYENRHGFFNSNSLQSLYLGGFNSGSPDNDFEMDTTGNHNHTGSTGFAGASTTGSTGVTTNAALTASELEGKGVIENTPPFVGLVFIMRVR